MVDGARPSANPYQIIDGTVHGLVAAGVPVGRFALFIYTLHPNMIGWRYTWTPEKGVDRSEGPDRAVLDRAVYGRTRCRP